MLSLTAFRQFFLTFSILGFLTLGGMGQEQQNLWIYPPVTPDAQTKELLGHIGTFVELGRFDEARQMLRRIATEQAGNSLGATALLDETFVCGLMGKPEDIPVITARVIQEYPGSRFEFAARMDPVRRELWSVPTEQAVAGWGAFAQSFGGPTIDQILAGTDLEGASAQVLALHPETRLSLSSIYSKIIGALQHGDRNEEALNVARFCRLSFDSHPERETSFALLIKEILGDMTGKSDLRSLPSVPNVTILSPANGASVGLQPTISVQATTGNYHYATVDLRRLSFLVDGEESQLQVEVASQLDSSLPENGNYETLTLSLTPALDPGPHTVTVKVRAMPTGQDPPSGPAETVTTWSFNVSSNPPPDDPTAETRAATKDALVFEKSPHSNEGANSILTLDKINGKAARNLLGFDLAGVNTNSLTNATLVLSINPSDQVTGWGNGETVSVKPVTVGWQEGNGKKHGLPGNQQTAGSGVGATWFSPTDDNISNDSANGVVQWSGAAAYATTGTAPALTVHNHQTGELRFNVTQDVLNGVTHGWLLRKDAENKGSKVSFYSREGGGPNLGPRLILDYGSTAMSEPNKMYIAVAAFFGFKSRPVTLQASAGGSEGSRGLKELLRGSPRAAYVGEQVVLGFAGHHPFTQLGARVVYRSWLRETASSSVPEGLDDLMSSI